ncbi:MAG: EAL domain-containing protein [Filomicrobium sp.]
MSSSIKREAEAKAVSWASDFVTQLPSIEKIIQTGYATPEQAQRIKDTIAVGDVIGFKLFTPAGKLTFCSNSGPSSGEDPLLNARALAVFQSGKSDVSFHHGHDEGASAGSHVEAYIPAVGPDGERMGVIEVYVDVSALDQVLHDSYSQLSIWLIFCSALVFLTPAAALIWRGKQLQMRDQRVASLQRIDQLTGILNRNSLTQEIDRVFADRAVDETIGVLFIDVDHFKHVNDTHGHRLGDEILRIVARTLKSSARNNQDVIGRYGGDEFVMLYRSIDQAGLRSAVERIKPALNDACRAVGGITPTLSIGAHLSRPGEDQQDALHAADIAVYEAKRRGRNQVIEYTRELETARGRELEVEKLLKRAIPSELLELHFQPMFAAKNRKLIGFEALLRLRDPAGGLISPGEFIPIAEKAGLMDNIGVWVLRRALDTAQTWPEDFFVSVNLSVAQFKSGDLPRRIFEVLDSREFDPSRLELEITESLLIDDEFCVWTQLQLIKEAGITIAIDDFGAGNTSVGHFWKFDFDKLKLDRSFLLACQYNPKRYGRLLHAISSFAKELHLTTVAEGIEVEDELEINVAAGVDQVQGFLLGRPMKVDELDQFIGKETEKLALVG